MTEQETKELIKILEGVSGSHSYKEAIKWVERKKKEWEDIAFKEGKEIYEDKFS